MGISFIIVKWLGGLLLALAGLTLLAPFLLWPPNWWLIKTAWDVARREEELRQQWRGQAERDDDAA